jgi:hypothetical protein
MVEMQCLTGTSILGLRSNSTVLFTCRLGFYIGDNLKLWVHDFTSVATIKEACQSPWPEEGRESFVFPSGRKMV